MKIGSVLVAAAPLCLGACGVVGEIPVDQVSFDAAVSVDGPAEDARSPGTTPDGAWAVDETAYLKRVVPVLVINLGGQTIPDDRVLSPKVTGTLKVIEAHDGSLSGIELQPATLEAQVGIGLHGNTSASLYDQRPYGLEIRDDKGIERAVSLLGLPKESDFILSSCYSDKTCMRNALSYAVGRELGASAGRWGAPRTRWVELIIDGDYRGLYLLAEKIKLDKGRVNLPKPAPSASVGDITGGYIFSGQGGGGMGSGTARLWPDPLNSDRYWGYRAPSPESMTDAQKAYLQVSFAGFLKAVAATPVWGETKRTLDAPSSIDFMLMQELSNNIDGYNKSWYFTKQPEPAGGLLLMGPLWDFDIAYGNVNMSKALCPTGLRLLPHLDSTGYDLGPRLPFPALFKDPALLADVRCRYDQLRQPGGAFDVDQIEAEIDAFADHIARAKARDQMKWKNIGRYIWPNNYVGSTWRDEVQYLKYWLRWRVIWLDEHLPGACAAPRAFATPRPLPPPPAIVDTRDRSPTNFGGAPRYIPIEGPVPAQYVAWACPGTSKAGP